MTTEVVAVRSDAPFKEIADLLADHGISAVPVVDDEDRVVGVVSEADLLHKTEFAGESVANRLLESRRHRTAREKAVGEVAGELMTAPAVTVFPETNLVEAARTMEEKEIKRLPVVDAEGRLVGIASRRDLLKVFLQSDAAIRDEVREQVFGRAMWIDPALMSVEVDRGVVTLAGELERRSATSIAVRLTRAVDGVVGVVDRLTYSFDDTADQRASRYMSPP
ncbi:MAG TPA: CBS domain-containing protein [Micromonosporaceae bacterium]|nr:CBS domain-containing protein [Micromonosporaceae bacterium]